MPKPEQLALDGGLAVGLLVALLVVWALDSGTGSAGPDGPTMDFKVIRARDNTGRGTLLGVTAKDHDDIGKILEELKIPFKPALERDLRDPNRLQNFAVIFITCSFSSAGDKEQNAALRGFVASGGILYVSDRRFDVLRGAFPEFIDPAAEKPGKENQNVKAKVIDPGLRNELGADVVLHFDKDSRDWRPAAFKPDMVSVLMRGTYRTSLREVTAPLLVRFHHGNGTVIFTSFHNADQGEVAKKLLQYLVFSAVTAGAEAALNRKTGDFAPPQSSLVSASQDQSVKYEHKTSKAGRLLFRLAFNEGQGAKLRLVVRGPDGKVAKAEDTASFAIEIPDAPAGDWEYTVTPLELPNPNFRFSTTVVEPR
jgi:hypothetical protein